MENNTEEKGLAKTQTAGDGLQVLNSLKESWEFQVRKATAYSQSTLVPKDYQGKEKIANCLIAIEMAGRIGASELMVMQHLNIIYGRPSWSSTFLIASINSCGRFNALRFKFTGQINTDTWGCIAHTVEKSTGEVLQGAEVTIGIAKKEGWYDKNGSKWKTMPELMLQYRSAALFSRVYCPEITMGMQSHEEVEDAGVINIDTFQEQVKQEIQDNANKTELKIETDPIPETPVVENGTPEQQTEQETKVEEAKPETKPEKPTTKTTKETINTGKPEKLF